MVFSDTTNQTGLIQYLDAKVSTGGANGWFTLEEKTAYLNRALDYVASIVEECDRSWTFDDNNYSTHAIATTDLIQGLTNYTLDFKHLEVTAVEVLNNGEWLRLNPVDVEKLDGSITDYKKTPGIPQEYDLKGNSLWIYPRSNEAVTAGLKLHFKRNMDYFVKTDTTKEPGFDRRFHELVGLKASLDWSIDKELAKQKSFKIMLDEMVMKLKEAYNRREKETVGKIRPMYQNNK